MQKKRLANRKRNFALSSLALAAAVIGTGRGMAAGTAPNQKKPAPKAAPVHHTPAHKAMAHAPAKQPAPAKPAQDLAKQQAAEQAKKQTDAAQANAANPAMARPVAAVTPQDPAKLVGVAQAPSQGDLDKKLVGEWLVTSSGSSLGTLKISGEGEYTWKKDDTESKGKLLQVIPRRDSKPGVTYWKLKDGKQEFYAFAHPDQKDTLALYAVDTNAAAAEATLKDGAKTTEKSAADTDKTDKPEKS